MSNTEQEDTRYPLTWCPCSYADEVTPFDVTEWERILAILNRTRKVQQRGGAVPDTLASDEVIRYNEEEHNVTYVNVNTCV